MNPPRLAQLACCLLALGGGAWAQDSTPFYVGGSVGLSHVSNVYRESSAPNADRVLSAGLTAGIDKHIGRQRLTVDASIQNNRYDKNRELNNLSYSLRSALDWQSVGDLGGTLSASRSRSLADFNIAGGVTPIRKANTERNDEISALVRKGVSSRYSLEAGWSHRSRDFTAVEYQRFVYRQDIGSLGVYAQPGGNLRLGLVGRYTDGQYPAYPVFFLGFLVGTQRIDYTRKDLDFTTAWKTGGTTQLDTRLSRSRSQNSAVLNDFSGTTGALGWTWQPTAKTSLRVQASRDNGVEVGLRGGDISRLYDGLQLTGSYAPTGKFTLQASVVETRSRRNAADIQQEAFDNDHSRSLAARWAYSRSLSLSCQIGRYARDSSVTAYTFNSTNIGCTGQAFLY